MTAPLVSIVITSFEQGALLDEAIRSALAQTHQPVEILVVDDGSRDGSASVARRYPSVRLIEQANGGVSAARNTGTAAATGDYVVFLDGDDRLAADGVETGLRHVLAEPGRAFAWGRHRLVDTTGRALPTRPRPAEQGDLYAAMLREAWVAPPGAMLAAREPLLSVGPWDTSLTAGGEDYDIYLRLARRYRGVDHTDVVCDYRLHAANRSKTYAACLADNLRVLAAQAPLVAGEPRLEAARLAGERHYRSVYGAKIALTAVLDAVRLRRGRLRAVLGAVVSLVDDPFGTVGVVVEKVRRRGRG